MEYPPVAIKVWGEFACFTRPELKVERVSYEVMTPSAARGVLEAAFWKPEFQWRVREIRVLRDIKFFSIVRNEVNNRAVYSTARQRIAAGEPNYAEDDRAQRHTLALRDVSYIITADVVVRADVTEDAAKYRDQFRRRVARGQCHHMPYLGCREFTAAFGEPDGTEVPIQNGTRDLGLMLFDIRYAPDGSGRGQPQFFRAQMENGILAVPSALYEEH
jgi:CRISPR-associated protein Cas5d